jgi:hypothetical protein
MDYFDATGVKSLDTIPNSVIQPKNARNVMKPISQETNQKPT